MYIKKEKRRTHSYSLVAANEAEYGSPLGSKRHGMGRVLLEICENDSHCAPKERRNRPVKV